MARELKLRQGSLGLKMGWLRCLGLAVLPGALLVGSIGRHTLPGVGQRVQAHLFQGAQVRRWVGQGGIGRADLISGDPAWWPENPSLALWQAGIGAGLGDALAYGLLLMLGWWWLGVGVATVSDSLGLGTFAGWMVGVTVQCLAWHGTLNGHLFLLGLGPLSVLLVRPGGHLLRGFWLLFLLGWWWPGSGAIPTDNHLPAYVGANLAVLPLSPTTEEAAPGTTPRQAAHTRWYPNGVEATLRGLPGGSVLPVPNPSWARGGITPAEWLVRAARHGHPVDLDPEGGDAPALQATLARTLGLQVSTSVAAAAWRTRGEDPLNSARQNGVCALWIHRQGLAPDAALWLDHWIAVEGLGPVVQDDGWMVVGINPVAHR